MQKNLCELRRHLRIGLCRRPLHTRLVRPERGYKRANYLTDHPADYLSI